MHDSRYRRGAASVALLVCLLGCGSGNESTSPEVGSSADSAATPVPSSPDTGQAVEADLDPTTSVGSEGQTDYRLIVDPEPFAVYRGHLDAPVTGSAKNILLLQDGRMASAGSGGVHVWDPLDPTGEPTILGLPVAEPQAEVPPGALPPPPPAPLPDVPIYDSSPSVLLELADGRVALATRAAVRIFELDSPEHPVRTFTGHRGSQISDLVQLADGRIASAGVDGSIQVWDPIVSGPPDLQNREPEELPDTMYLTLEPGFDYGEWLELGLSEYPPSYIQWRQLFATPDGSLVARDADGVVRTWDPSSLSPSDAMVTSDGVELWDLTDVASVPSGLPEEVADLQPLSNGGWAVIADWGIYFLDDLQQEPVEVFESLSVSDATSMASLAEGRLAIAATFDFGLGVAIADPAADRIDAVVQVPEAPSGFPRLSVIGLDEQRLAVLSSHVDVPVYVWDLDGLE